MGSHLYMLRRGGAGFSGMRMLAGLFAILSVCSAQSAENEVASVLRQMERAEQAGDGSAWVALWSREKSADAEHMRPYIRPRPDARYRESRIFVQGDEAVVLAQVPPDNFVTMIFHRENAAWKVHDQLWRNTAANPDSVYALIPPDSGAFSRAGSPWDDIAPALDPDRAAKLGWQMRSVFDESFLYIRLEAGATLPLPGSTTDQSPGAWPVLKIAIDGADEFVLLDAVDIGDQATFDENGKANSHRPFAAYSMRLEHNNREVFTVFAGLEASPLIEVAGRGYQMRIPLRSMGITDSRTAGITIGDAQWPKSAIVTLKVRRYPR